MQKNKIEGVQPFNKFNFRSCYYQQLITGLAVFGISYEKILLSNFVFSKKHFAIEKMVIPEKTLEKVLGYQNKRCNLSKKQLLQNIDNQHLIIAGVDCFYFESRPDTYRKMHDPHYILVYGYDLDRNTLNVVDHNYRNSIEYSEKIISLDNLLYANKMLHNGPIGRRTTANILIKKSGGKQEDASTLLRRYKAETFQEAKNNSEFNLRTLKSLISQNSAALLDLSNVITQYLQEMKDIFFNLNSVTVFNRDRNLLEKIFIIIGAYSNLLSIFWRMDKKNDYGFAFRNKENILRKIDELIGAEKIIYDYISEICKCRS